MPARSGSRPRPPPSRRHPPRHTVRRKQCLVPALEQHSPRPSARPAWRKVPSRWIRVLEVLGYNLTLPRLESKWGIFDRYSFCCPSCPGCPRTVTRPLKSAPRRRATAQPLRTAPHHARHRQAARALTVPPNRSTALRHVIATAQPLKSAPRHRCRSTAQVNRSTAQPLKSPFTLTFSCHSYFFMSLLQRLFLHRFDK